MEFLTKAVQTVNAYLSDYVLIVLLLGIGIFYSVKTRFVQVRCFGEGMKQVFGGLGKGKGGSGGMSSFQALATAIAAQVGTGNIVGACGAILTGGPGAIFWMWLIAFFGMATIYAEAVLAQKTRVTGENGEITGGPVYYITTAFKGKFGKFLAGFFALFAVLALGLMGAMIQSNSIGSTLNTAFGIPNWVGGIIAAVLAGFVFIGGVKRLASVTEKIVPIMAALFLIGTLAVIIIRIKDLPEAIMLIFKYAFKPNAIIGGGIGAALKIAISQGAKRGLFSNEAGMGSTPHAHALANVNRPHEQGIVAMIGVFIDTFIVLTMNALVVITVLYTGNGPLANGAAGVEGIDKANMSQIAFSAVFGDKVGGIFIAVCLFFFAFSTIISWNLFGKINFNYLFGKKAVIVYSILAIVFTFLGTVLENDFVWDLQDMFNQLIVIPNVLALFALSKTVIAELKDAQSSKKKNAESAK